MGLNELEQRIQSGVYYQKGEALATIIKHELYKPFGSFEAYCHKRLGFTPERARQFIDAADVVHNLKSSPTTGLLLPASEAVCRPLAGLPRDKQILVWDWILLDFPDGKVTSEQIAAIVSQVKVEPDRPMQFITRADIPDTKWPSNNDLEIPLLDIHWQAGVVDLPFVLWGTKGRRAVMPGTYHFYTSDYRFEALWDDPSTLINSQCVSAVEPNFSIYDQTPRIAGLYRIYLKRYLARTWQHFGVRILVDMNVSPEFYQDNLLGVPAGWRAYATRGYTDRLHLTEQEYKLAAERAGTRDILFVVYGGGRQVREYCQRRAWLWFAEHMSLVKGRRAVGEAQRVG